MLDPIVSVIIPSFNRESLISETMDSLMNQSYENWECIVVDDGSTDSTIAVVEKYSRKEPRIKLLSRPSHKSKGANACRNYGFENCKGKYINWFDSDDLATSDKLDKQVRYLELNESYSCVIGQARYFEDVGNKSLGFWNDILSSDRLLEDFITKKIGWSPNSPLWRRSFLEENNLTFDESLQNGQDYDYHIAILSRMPKIKFIPDVLTLIRIHSNKIGNLKEKAESKAIIYCKLLTIRDRHSLEHVDKYLDEFAFKILKRFLLEKKIKQGIQFSGKINNLHFKKRLEVARIIGFGLLFKFFNKGYSFLKASS